MNARPLSVTVTLILILLAASIWLALGLIIAGNRHPALPDILWIKSVLAVGSLAAGAALLGLSFFLSKRNRSAYFAARVLLAVTCLLILFDDVGWTDVAVLFINVAPLVLLIKDRDWYLQPPELAEALE